MASAIIIPVLVHLRNMREGKTLKVGSVLLLRQSARQHARSFRIREWLLLVLRCLLIVLLSLLLAAPSWWAQPKAVQQKGWIVVERQYKKELYKAYGHQIDSLFVTGLSLHFFETGFPVVKKEALVHSTDSSAATPPYWGLLQQLYRQVPADMPVYLYTGNQLSRFAGKRPSLPMKLQWQVVTPADSTANWIAAAYLSSPDSIQVTRGNSRPASLSYTVENIPATGAAQRGYSMSFEKGKLLLQQTNSDEAPIKVDTSTIEVVMYTDTYPDDAVYLRAAIRAIQQYSRRRIRLQSISNLNNQLPAPDWLFWLSDKPVPFIRDCNIFRYVAGREQSMRSWLVQADRQSTDEPIALYKSISDSTADPDDTPLWQDGYGHPVLTKTSAGAATFFNFYSRFHPRWTDLVWNTRFPVWMLPLLLGGGDEPENSRHDKRVMNSGQIMAAIQPVKQNGQITIPPQKTDLGGIVWIAAFLVFLLERIIATSNKKQTA